MGLITGILSLPLAPIRSVTWVADQMKQQAEREYFDPALIQRQLADVDDAHAAGELSSEERDVLQRELVARLFEAQHRREAGEM
jgi:hypothetical protein